ncbi:MAG: MBL fold metallo-hydrolase [Pseudomonadales bacterium]|nr:MBL fold metallo-hydrolase [Pseudomonadales bacterium]MDG2078740.1 MBL fold metallo-hydrolase [Pseudomonadales bacterium]
MPESPVLHYPFKKNWHPEPGEPFEVVSGVYWLRMPLPIKLDHINLWLLKDGSGWTIVDTGYYDETCKAIWEGVFTHFVLPEKVTRIIVTHFHPDHMGLASWLAEKCDCRVVISKPEYDLYYLIRTRDKAAFRQRAAAFMVESGADEELQRLYANALSDTSQAKTLPRSVCEFVDEPDALLIDGRHWQFISGNGHSPLHLCLYCKELKVMIAGDQALPRITSIVSVSVENADQNPLLDWLDSCRKLQAVIPDSTLVLPSHQEPFTGIHLRMQQLIESHEKQLRKLLKSLPQKNTATEISFALFARKLDSFGRLMAIGETLAHINYLIEQRSVDKKINSEGVARYHLN